MLLVFKARGNVDSHYPVVLVASIFLVIAPTGILMYRVVPSFNLLWMSGIRSSRRQTIRLMMSIMLIRMGILFLCVMAMVLAVLATRTTIFTAIAILIGSTGVGALLLVMASWTRRWWEGFADYAFTGLAIIATLGCGLALFAFEPYLTGVQKLNPFDVIIIVGSLFATAIIWWAAILEVPRALHNRIS